VFLFDSMMVGGLRWVLKSVGEAAMAELNDDKALRAALLDAGVRLELGEICEDEFAQIEEELLARISEIRSRRETATGPIEMTGSVEACTVGDFYEAIPQPQAIAHNERRSAGRKP
jgi:hypothetical protein